MTSASTDTELGIERVVEQHPLHDRYTPYTTILASPQNLTTSWANIGAVLPCGGYNTLGLWLTITANNSTGIQFRMQGLLASEASEKYSGTIGTINGSLVNIDDLYYELSNNESMLIVIEIPIHNIIPYAQLQVQATSVGSTAGRIDLAHVTYGWK